MVRATSCSSLILPSPSLPLAFSPSRSFSPPRFLSFAPFACAALASARLRSDLSCRSQRNVTLLAHAVVWPWFATAVSAAPHARRCLLRLSLNVGRARARRGPERRAEGRAPKHLGPARCSRPPHSHFLSFSSCGCTAAALPAARTCCASLPPAPASSSSLPVSICRRRRDHKRCKHQKADTRRLAATMTTTTTTAKRARRAAAEREAEDV